MRLLLVNGNMTEAVTTHVVREASLTAQPSTQVAGVTARFGANIVTAEPENVIAAHAVLDLLATHCHNHDAAILAISFDSGLVAAQEMLPIPVIGMTDAALWAASKMSDRVGVVIFGEASRTLYETTFARCRARTAISHVAVIAIDSVGDYLDLTKREAAVLEAIRAMTQTHQIGAAIVCGAAMAGMTRKLQPLAPVPLFDGIACAVQEAETLHALGTHKLKPRSALAASSKVTGLGEALQKLFDDRNQGRFSV